MPSVVSTGDAYCNALAEILFAGLKTELPAWRGFQSQVEPQMATSELLAGRHNLHRRHPAAGYLLPIYYQRRMSL